MVGRSLLSCLLLVVPALTAGAQAQLRELGKKHLPRDPDNTQAVAFGDVDGDGDLDIVYGNRPFGWPSFRNRLYLNDGRGRFVDATATHLPDCVNPIYSIALGDLDGDGDLDLLAGGSRAFLLHVNDGRGKFAVRYNRLAGPGVLPFVLTIANVDGDGDLDVLAGGAGTGGRGKALYLNDGKARFTNAVAETIR